MSIYSVDRLRALPMACAVIDPSGEILCHTPEWSGAGAAAVIYGFEQMRLVVGSSMGPGGDPPDLAGAMMVHKVLEAVEAGKAVVDTARRRRLEMVAEALRVVTGRLAGTMGTSQEVVEYLECALPARSDIELRLMGAPGAAPVEAPAAVASALLQIAVNAREHAAGIVPDTIDLSVHIEDDGSVTFRLQWDGQPPSQALRTSRVQRNTGGGGRGTGLASARIFVDAVGGRMSGLIPAIAPGGGYDGLRTRMEVSVGHAGLSLPLALIRGADVAWANPAWHEEASALDPAEFQVGLQTLIGMARAQPDAIRTRNSLAARTAGDEVIVVQPPDDPLERAHLAARILSHEERLISLPPAHAARLAAVADLLRFTLGMPLPYVTADVWNAEVRRLFAVYGIQRALPIFDGEAILDPVVSVYLIAEYSDGDVIAFDDEVLLRIRPDKRHDPLAEMLSDGRGTIVLHRPS